MFNVQCAELAYRRRDRHRGFCNGTNRQSAHRYQSRFAKEEIPSGSNGNEPCTALDMTATHDIQARTFELACRIIEFCRSLATSDYVIRRLASQLLDAGTSIGANLEEADSGQTKRDFIAKTAIARKESAETRYWLRTRSPIPTAETLNIEH